MLAMQWQLERSQWWTPESILEHQFRQIRLLAAHAVASVTWYRNALRDTGIGSASDLTPGTFRRWPILRKREVRPNEDALRAASYPKEHGGTMETWTTGSTGEPTRVVHTQAVEFFTHALIMRENLWHERDFSRRFAAIRSMKRKASLPGWGVPNAMFATGPGCVLDSATDVDAQLDWLVAERPGYLVSQANNLRALILRSRETGQAPPGIDQLITISDTPASDLAELARETWHARLVATYSSEEFGSIAVQCPGHGHYLVHAENLYLEVLRDDGEPCAPGETGRVVITALHNFVMPLIRYEIGDYAQLGGACPTGRGLPVLARVVGRERNMARDPDGRRFWPSFPAKMWIAIAPFRRVQLVQHTPSVIEARFVIERELTAPESARLVEALRGRLGYPFEIRLARVPAIERAPGDKYEEFISLLPQDRA